MNKIAVLGRDEVGFLSRLFKILNLRKKTVAAADRTEEKEWYSNFLLHGEEKEPLCAGDAEIYRGIYPERDLNFEYHGRNKHLPEGFTRLLVLCNQSPLELNQLSRIDRKGMETLFLVQNFTGGSIGRKYISTVLRSTDKDCLLLLPYDERDARLNQRSELDGRLYGSKLSADYVDALLFAASWITGTETEGRKQRKELIRALW